MILRLAALALLLTLIARPAEAACPAAGGGLLFHSCWGAARISLKLLPDDLPLSRPPAEGLRLVVTGTYTGTGTRTSGAHKPVGLFLRRGEVINRNLAHMDGVLVIDPESGQPDLQHRERVRLGATVYDLRELDQRSAFIKAAAARGLSVMQSHLLISDGQVDVTQQESAPAHVRRLLFANADGFGVWQTPVAMTLRDAAVAIDAALAPDMAINLDMGSYDFCRRTQAGAETNCGALSPEATGKLSNLLLLTLR